MKRTRKPTSLRRLLLLRLTAPLAVLLLIGAYAAYRYAEHYANAALDIGLYDMAQALAQQVQVSENGTFVSLPKEAIDLFEWDASDTHYYSVTTSLHGMVFGNAVFPASTSKTPVGSEPRFFDDEIEGNRVRIVAIALRPKIQGSSERIVIRIAHTLGSRQKLARELLLTIIVPQALLLFAALIAIGYGVAVGLRPLAEVAGQIRVRHPGDLSPLRTDVPTEVTPLSDALNRLFAELEEAQNAQQRFIADAAHQLRTPLATLQVQAERALRERDPVAGAEAVRHVLLAAQRLNHLVQQLLTLARSEPTAAANQALQPCDLATLARAAAAEWVPAALEHGVDLGYSGPDRDVVVPGNPLLLRELINNLVDNALKYGRCSQGHSHVTVAIEQSPVVSLCVEDNGQGIPPEARERVMERFVRLLGNSASGCGLGLSIVREIAARHGAQVTIDAGAMGIGTRIVVTFPTAPLEATADEESTTANSTSAQNRIAA